MQPERAQITNALEDVAGSSSETFRERHRTEFAPAPRYDTSGTAILGLDEIQASSLRLSPAELTALLGGMRANLASSSASCATSA